MSSYFGLANLTETKEFPSPTFAPFSLFIDSYLADNIYKKPVMIYNYPKDSKPFFTRMNDDKETVAAFDLVVPKVRSNLTLCGLCGWIVIKICEGF